MQTRISIISSTDRPGSASLKVSRYLQKVYENAGASADLISLEDFPLTDVVGGRYGQDIPSVKAFNERVLASDGLLFVIPEYNGSYPGIFKMFIDYLPFPQSFLGVPIAFVGVAAGAFGALRAVEQAQQVVGYRNAYVFPERVFIQQVKQNFSEEEGLKVPLQQKLLTSQVTNFLTFVSQQLPKQSL
jgi:NAD(P)H-dependent FMN reductase